MKRLIALVAIVFALTACVGGGRPGGGATPSNEIPGVEAPHLGIRTDVNEFIISRYGDSPSKLEAARLVAKHDQTSLRVVVADGSLTQTEVSKRAYALICLFHAVGPHDFHKASRELAAVTFNTPDRLRAQVDFSRKLSGMEIGGPKVANSCESAK